MDRFDSLLGSAERVLELAERWLGDHVDAQPSRAFFDEAIAFRWDETRGRGRLVAVPKPALFDLDDLVGIDDTVAALVRNTEQLVRGLPFNHVLLYGDRGTGKSSAVRGLLARFADRGLRVVEVRREDLARLPRVVAALAADDARHRFIVFCDDLSFGGDEPGFRELKAALEGSIEAPPPGVCLVATSNRRHLVPESMAENRGAHVDEQGELHLGEALEEKLALSDRFGLSLGFYVMTQQVYLQAVAHYAQQAAVDLPADEVRSRALTWAVRRASRSGRTARQFVDDLVGRLALERGESAEG